MQDRAIGSWHPVWGRISHKASCHAYKAQCCQRMATNHPPNDHCIVSSAAMTIPQTSEAVTALAFYPLLWYPSLHQGRVRQRQASTIWGRRPKRTELHDSRCLVAEHKHSAQLFLVLLVTVHGKEFSFGITAWFESMVEFYTSVFKIFGDKQGCNAYLSITTIRGST